MRDETPGPFARDIRTRPGAHSPNGGASSADYLPWVAVGAVVVGAAGALAGLMRQPRGRRWPEWKPVAGPGDLTPPHGDKLQPYE